MGDRHGVRQKDLIVTLETEPNTQWFRASVGITYKDEFSAMDCTRGLPPTTIHFTGGVANNEFKMKSPQPFISECIEVGGGWNSSIRVSNGEPKYSLTLGQVE